MATRTITAMFDSRAHAEQASQSLISDLGLTQASIRLSPEGGQANMSPSTTDAYEEKGFFASLKDLFVPDEDRFAYAEGVRRGNVLLTAEVEESHIDRASDILEHAGAVDLDAQEASWRQSGWTGYDANAHAAARTSAPVAAPAATTTPVATGMSAAGTSATRAGQDDTIKVLEERLVVGKRAVEHGRVRVRAYVVERPVEEQVTLHQETVHVDRRAVDRPASAAELDAFQERVIEAKATGEEAVVGKDVRVVEEIGVHKDAADRVETVRDTVRHTEVDVEDTTTGGTVHPGMTQGTASAVDRTLNTNVSGTNPAAAAPDGTPGNPPGTMASRAVDKTLGTNVSGANPARKS